MSYAHNSEADFAGSELARLIAATPSLCYSPDNMPANVSAAASYEPSTSPWPKADGLVSLLEPGGSHEWQIALEYKRQQEGVHGLLTAIGQAYAYLNKGYSGAAIVIPREYSSLPEPAEYVTTVLNRTEGSGAIGVFHYQAPDVTSPTPFSGRLHCVRPLRLVAAAPAERVTVAAPKTQWVHMREGSTTRDAFFRFLQTAKRLSAGAEAYSPVLDKNLIAAIARVAPGRDPYDYLANIADERFLSRVWRAFWFDWILTDDVRVPWIRREGTYAPPQVFCRADRDDGRGKSQIFEGRANGLKETLAGLLNSHQITEDQAWEMFVQGVPRQGAPSKQGIRERAHSYREDLDSALAHLQWIDSDGRPTDQGYRYMTTCEKYGGANSPAAMEYVGATLLQTGRYAAFLHYVHRLSERRFAVEPLAFTREASNGRPEFTEESYTEYLEYLEDRMAEELKVIRKVAQRDRPRVRTKFQAELTLLRNYGFVSPQRHRLAVGIPINWERILDTLDVDL